MSTLKVTNIAGLTGSSTNVIEGLAKAWGNCNGLGTVSLRDSFNLSGLTDNGAGLYQFNISSSMSDGNFAAQITSKPFDGGTLVALATLDEYNNTTNPLSTGYVKSKCGQTGTSNTVSNDCSHVMCTAYGDLA